MKNVMNTIDMIDIIKNYLELKRLAVEKGYENIVDVVKICSGEVTELLNIVKDMEIFVSLLERTNVEEKRIHEETSYIYEERLLDEIADVLLTTIRLVDVLNLYEPLNEMLEFKYNRQVERDNITQAERNKIGR